MAVRKRSGKGKAVTRKAKSKPKPKLKRVQRARTYDSLRVSQLKMHLMHCVSNLGHGPKYWKDMFQTLKLLVAEYRRIEDNQDTLIGRPPVKYAPGFGIIFTTEINKAIVWNHIGKENYGKLNKLPLSALRDLGIHVDAESIRELVRMHNEETSRPLTLEHDYEAESSLYQCATPKKSPETIIGAILAASTIIMAVTTLALLIFG